MLQTRRFSQTNILEYFWPSSLKALRDGDDLRRIYYLLIRTRGIALRLSLQRYGGSELRQTMHRRGQMNDGFGRWKVECIWTDRRVCLKGFLVDINVYGTSLPEITAIPPQCRRACSSADPVLLWETEHSMEQEALGDRCE